jgi:hypothetical protein
VSSGLDSISKELVDAQIQFKIQDDQIHIPLPNDFDTLIIEIWNDEGEDSISLLNGSFHTHGDLDAREYGLPTREKAIRYLVESIFDGTFKMVKVEVKPGVYKKTIWDTLALESIDEDDKFLVASEI